MPCDDHLDPKLRSKVVGGSAMPVHVSRLWREAIPCLSAADRRPDGDSTPAGSKPAQNFLNHH